jgi:hypothetical protein
MHINVQNERQFNKSEHCKSQVLTLAVYPFLKQHSKTFHPQPRKGTPFDLCRQYQNKLTRKTNSYKATSFVYWKNYFSELTTKLGNCASPVPKSGK